MTLSEFQQTRRLLLAVAILAAFAVLVFVGSSWSHEAHRVIETAGLALMLVGIVGRAWCTLYIGGRKSQEIVREGPYSMTRNPLYVFSSIAALGIGLQTGSLAVGLLFFWGSLLAFGLVIRREEAHLLGIFGEPYDHYRASVPRFWPNMKLFRDRSTLTVPASRLYRTLGDGLLFLVSIPAFEAVEHLQEIGVVPVSLHLC